MGLAETMKRATALAEGMVHSARAKAAGGSLVGGPGAGAGVFGQNTPGAQRERLRHFVGWPAALTRVVAQKIAAQPLRMARKSAVKPSGRATLAKRYAPGFVKTLAEGLDLIEDHWLLTALGSPNEYLSYWQTVWLTVASLEMTGEAYWFIERGEGTAKFYYLSPDWVTPVHTDNELFESYKVLVPGTGKQQDVPAEDMVRFAVPDPRNPYAGCTSSLQSNALAVVTDEAIQVAQQRAMQNGIFPAMGLVIGRHPDVAGVPGMRPILTKEQRSTLTAAIKQAYRGVANAGEPILLDGLIEDVKKLSMSPDEMGFLEGGKTTKERISQGWLTNPIVMGQVENVNRATATVAYENWYDSKVNPLIDLVGQGLTHQVAPKCGAADVLLWIEPCRANDPDQKRSDLDQLAKYGCLKRNELRDAHDLPALEGPEGDELIEVSGPSLTLGSGEDGDGQRAGTFRW